MSNNKKEDKPNYLVNNKRLNEKNKDDSTMPLIATGTAIGAAVGGPIGAAVGGGVAAIVSLFKKK